MAPYEASDKEELTKVIPDTMLGPMPLSFQASIEGRALFILPQLAHRLENEFDVVTVKAIWQQSLRESFHVEFYGSDQKYRLLDDEELRSENGFYSPEVSRVLRAQLDLYRGQLDSAPGGPVAELNAATELLFPLGSRGLAIAFVGSPFRARDLTEQEHRTLRALIDNTDLAQSELRQVLKGFYAELVEALEVYGRANANLLDPAWVKIETLAAIVARAVLQIWRVYYIRMLGNPAVDLPEIPNVNAVRNVSDFLKQNAPDVHLALFPETKTAREFLSS